MMKRILISIVAMLSLLPMASAPLALADGGSCGSTKTGIISCDSGTKTGLGAINSLIKIAVLVMSVMIGTVAVGGLVYAAILYASAQDSQEQINNARTIMRNIIIGLILYVFTVVIVNWLIPGGVIG